VSRNESVSCCGIALYRLSTELAEKGRHILMFTSEEAKQADEQVADLLDFCVDALLLMSAGLSTELAIRCFDDVEASAWPSFNLTTNSFPIEDLTEEMLKIPLSDPRPDNIAWRQAQAGAGGAGGRRWHTLSGDPHSYRF